MRRRDLIEEMLRVAPFGVGQLPLDIVSELTKLTSELVAVSSQSIEEYARFCDTASRTLGPSEHRTAYLEGKRILVTGGTGCIGSAILHEIADHSPSRLLSVSRVKSSTTDGMVPGVDYMDVDVADRHALSATFDLVQPDIVFHLAAQRDPGLAEIEVEETVKTNVFGTWNVLRECQDRHVDRLIYASTGKTVRLHSVDVYVTTKRIGECMLAAASARSDIRIAAARFTHVVDNSIVFDRIRQARRTRIIRLHDPHMGFYVQSATESAELLLSAGATALTGTMMINAIRDLGWPIDLLDLTLGYLSSSLTVAPIYFCGLESGYDRTSYAGLVDPEVAGQVSPLINSFEARRVQGSPRMNIDASPAIFSDINNLDSQLYELDKACGGSSDVIKSVLAMISQSLLDCTLSAVSIDELERADYLASLPQSSMPREPDTVRFIRDRVRYWIKRQNCGGGRH